MIKEPFDDLIFAAIFNLGYVTWGVCAADITECKLPTGKRTRAAIKISVALNGKASKEGGKRERMHVEERDQEEKYVEGRCRECSGVCLTLQSRSQK